ncbi:HXXEE domain-containing protein [Streptomyces sp. 6-11-2]|uniref:HXXEE domain-containing protein n=1 Tax=Streptomyces sp. 6-11-2 TaxID=2585753 RepID=UPI00116B8259|nr:HXXEE domain-containing protein [Streptomyces sp. 6-11-2]GED84457.1 hypothetical protein TNCT6_15420 [Streptomyces sp. 6-11-2]
MCPAVTFGLLAAWAPHDVAELAAVPGWQRRSVSALRERFPGVPEAVWRRLGSVDTREFAVVVGMMGAIAAAASVGEGTHRRGVPEQVPDRTEVLSGARR